MEETMTTPDDTHDHEACVKLFTDTMARLNEISESQMQSILDIAIAAADAADSVAPSDASADAFVEKVAALIEDLKSRSAGLEGEMGGGGSPRVASPANEDKFCETIERDINMAIENSLSLQQQLNVTGVAVLTQGAALVLNAGTNDAN